MAHRTDLRWVLHRIIVGLLKFQKAKNWNDEDYWIYYQLDEEWDRVNIVFVARPFNGAELFASYREVWEFLQKQMEDSPESLTRINLVVRSEDQVQQGGIYSIGREYKEYFTFYPAGTTS